MTETTEQSNVLEIGGNLTKLKKDIARAHQQLTDIEAKRSALNSEAEAIRADIEEKGIGRKAFAAARSIFKTEAEKRTGFDEAYLIAREAMGIPVQGDLFGTK